MGFTKEEKRAWIANYEAKRAERKKDRNKHLKDNYQMRLTHDWAGAWVKHNTVGSARSFEKTHCKKCGIHILNFKAAPCVCPGHVEDDLETETENDET